VALNAVSALRGALDARSNNGALVVSSAWSGRGRKGESQGRGDCSIKLEEEPLRVRSIDSVESSEGVS
jgi:hypothetical protein